MAQTQLCAFCINGYLELLMQKTTAKIRGSTSQSADLEAYAEGKMDMSEHDNINRLSNYFLNCFN